MAQTPRAEQTPPLQTVTAGTVYFALAFAAEFVLGVVRDVSSARPDPARGWVEHLEYPA